MIKYKSIPLALKDICDDVTDVKEQMSKVQWHPHSFVQIQWFQKDDDNAHPVPHRNAPSPINPITI